MKPDTIICGDALEVMAGMSAGSVDLVFGSPPYEDCRTYGIDFSLKGQEWVDWMVGIIKASLRISKGLVAFVVEGKTKDFRWSATPALLMADLHRAGIHLRKPPAFNRIGIPGSGGPDWWRNDYEFIVCATNGGKLPWSDNTAMGESCKYGPGGAMSHRTQGGTRVGHKNKMAGMVSSGAQPKVERFIQEGGPPGAKLHTKRDAGGQRVQAYIPPPIANPGNIVNCGAAGGGRLGHELCHENEAPFPEFLAENFIRSFCPPGGIVCDPFSGSGTTCAVAAMHDRHYIGIDIRQSQVDLARERIGAALAPETFTKADTPEDAPLFAKEAT